MSVNDGDVCRKCGCNLWLHTAAGLQACEDPMTDLPNDLTDDIRHTVRGYGASSEPVGEFAWLMSYEQALADRERQVEHMANGELLVLRERAERAEAERDEARRTVDNIASAYDRLVSAVIGEPASAAYCFDTTEYERQAEQARTVPTISRVISDARREALLEAAAFIKSATCSQSGRDAYHLVWRGSMSDFGTDLSESILRALVPSIADSRG